MRAIDLEGARDDANLLTIREKKKTAINIYLAKTKNSRQQPSHLPRGMMMVVEVLDCAAALLRWEVLWGTDYITVI